MRKSVIALALVVLGVQADEQIGGNWYGKSVRHQKFSFGKPGSFMRVTKMTSDGHCEQEKKEYGGGIAPFDEELSIHMRGPIKINRIACYAPAPASKVKRSAGNSGSHAHQHRHGHHHFHERDAHIRQVQERAVAHAKRAVGDVVTATINGEVKTWTNTYAGGVPTTAPAPAPADAGPSAPLSSSSSPASPAPPGSDANGSAAKDSDDGKPNQPLPDIGTRDWTRTCFYDSASQVAQGLTFLNNHGGHESGVFDTTYGQSLSYASADAQNGASSPQILAKDLTIPSNKEVVIFSDRKCENGDCGFVRPGTVAYHGFAGHEKAFMFEFQMPDDGKMGDKFDNPNMPALWLLNAHVPRTGQYVNDDRCSCWKSGCGELDLFEVLDPGNKRCAAAVHSNHALTPPDYFDRPVDKTVHGTVIFVDGNAHIKMLDDDVPYANTLTADVIKKLM